MPRSATAEAPWVRRSEVDDGGEGSSTISIAPSNSLGAASSGSWARLNPRRMPRQSGDRRRRQPGPPGDAFQDLGNWKRLELRRARPTTNGIVRRGAAGSGQSFEFRDDAAAAAGRGPRRLNTAPETHGAGVTSRAWLGASLGVFVLGEPPAKTATCLCRFPPLPTRRRSASMLHHSTPAEFS